MEEDMIIFEICHELLLTGKHSRPKKTLKKGVTVRVNLIYHIGSNITVEQIQIWVTH
jgi:lysozyme family protein